MKRTFFILAATLLFLGALVGWVSLAGGLPEPMGATVGQFISRKVHFVFLFLSIAFLVFGRLRANETRLVRVLWVLGAVAIHFAVVQLGKKFIFWARPIDVGHTAENAVRASGFPSGHTVPAFIIAVMVGYIEPRLQIPALITASLIGYSRAEVLAHFPLQVWLSAILGMALGLLWTKVHSRFVTRATALAA